MSTLQTMASSSPAPSTQPPSVQSIILRFKAMETSMYIAQSLKNSTIHLDAPYLRTLWLLELYFFAGYHIQKHGCCGAATLACLSNVIVQWGAHHRLNHEDCGVFLRRVSMLAYLGLGRVFEELSLEVSRLFPDYSEKELAELEYELLRPQLVDIWKKANSLPRAVRCVKGMPGEEAFGSWDSRFKHRTLFSRNNKIYWIDEFKAQSKVLRTYADKYWPEIPTQGTPITLPAARAELPNMMEAYRAGVALAGPHSLAVPPYPFGPETLLPGMTQGLGKELAYLVGKLDDKRAKDAKKQIEHLMGVKVERDPRESGAHDNIAVKSEIQEEPAELQDIPASEPTQSGEANGQSSYPDAFGMSGPPPDEMQLPSNVLDPRLMEVDTHNISESIFFGYGNGDAFMPE